MDKVLIIKVKRNRVLLQRVTSIFDMIMGSVLCVSSLQLIFIFLYIARMRSIFAGDVNYIRIMETTTWEFEIRILAISLLTIAIGWIAKDICKRIANQTSAMTRIAISIAIVVGFVGLFLAYPVWRDQYSFRQSIREYECTDELYAAFTNRIGRISVGAGTAEVVRMAGPPKTQNTTNVKLGRTNGPR